MLNTYTPDDVTTEVDRLLGEPSWTNQSLYGGILNALEYLSEHVVDARPTADMVLGVLAPNPEYEGLTKEQVKHGLEELAMASKRAMTIRDELAVIHTSVHEISRRVSGLLGEPGLPRRKGLFREPEAR